MIARFIQTSHSLDGETLEESIITELANHSFLTSSGQHRQPGDSASTGGGEGLVDLAFCAARAKHQIHGIEFNESCDIDIVTDIKFVVVSVGLPLGRE